LNADARIDDVMKSIENSLEQVLVATYSQVLQCPNLEVLKRNLNSTKDAKKIDVKIESACRYFQRHPNKQKVLCNQGKCTYIQKLDQDLGEFQSELDLKIKDIIGY